MPSRTLDIGVVTDEVARTLAEALEIGTAWGLERFELREGAEGRFPFFTPPEIRLVEEALRRSHRITAVSPGLFKGSVEEQKQREHEIDNVLPRAIDLAGHFDCRVLISFGFAKYDGEPAANRVQVLHAFERVAEAAAGAGMIVALENEPDFWIDRPDASVALLDELGHPALRINWDPANLHRGGMRPTYEGFEVLRPYLANLHVKDFTPHDAVVPWRPLGQGTTPWGDILAWIVEETNLEHVTLETHCEPLLEQTQESLGWLRAALETMRAAPR